MTIFDPDYTWKKKTFSDFTAKELLIPIFINGECVYDSPTVDQIRTYCQEQVSTLWDEVLRFENPYQYYVDLSPKLWQLKQDMLSSKD